jgi:hypothetical protein
MEPTTMSAPTGMSSGTGSSTLAVLYPSRSVTGVEPVAA